MTKKEICTRICEELLEQELLNEKDAFDIKSLMQDVTAIIDKHLEDYVLVCKTNIISEYY